MDLEKWDKIEKNLQKKAEELVDEINKLIE